DVIALSLTDGHIYWRTHVYGNVFGSPTYSAGRLYVADLTCNAYCFNAATGSQYWRQSVGDSTVVGFYGSPAVSNGKIFLGLSNVVDGSGGPCARAKVAAWSTSAGAVGWP